MFTFSTILCDHNFESFSLFVVDWMISSSLFLFYGTYGRLLGCQRVRCTKRLLYFLFRFRRQGKANPPRFWFGSSSAITVIARTSKQSKKQSTPEEHDKIESDRKSLPEIANITAAQLNRTIFMLSSC